MITGITSMMVGNSDVAKAYVGNTVVYQPQPQYKVIYYTSTDGQIVDISVGGMISNTYSGGTGVITFNSGSTATLIGAPNKTTLRTVTLPEDVTFSIDYNNTFRGCIALTNINLEKVFLPANSDAFSGCTSLRTANIIYTNDVGFGAFSGCTSLTSVTFSTRLFQIQSYAFDGCTSLTSVNYLGTVAEWEHADPLYETQYAFRGVPATVVHCSDGDHVLG